MEVWKLFIDTEKKKMRPAVHLTLTACAREAVTDSKPADIGKETGLDEIIVKLDAVHLKYENTHAYVAFKEFYEFKKTDGKRFSEFIVKYEHLYHKLPQYKMDLPEGVQAGCCKYDRIKLETGKNYIRKINLFKYEIDNNENFWRSWCSWRGSQGTSYERKGILCWLSKRKY